MSTILRPALVLLAVMTLLTGIVMPLAMTGVGQMAFPHQANGSLIERDGTVIGSALIGQAFTSDRYVHARPSATTEPDPVKPGKTRPAPYNASASAASQLGPTSADLLAAVKARAAVNGPAPVPADAVYASGSGLDPHISLDNALRQVPRVAAARGLPDGRVRRLVQELREGREFGVLGEPRVNVLQLNLALDGLR
ncbi:MAG: potassium-transporting ATPase subunit KdpC [Acetobacteraceae bacterium]